MFDLDLLDDVDPFEIDRQPAHPDPRKCQPIGCYVAADHLARLYEEDR
ncbi:MAG: hypothetical protein U0904_07665 [Candidatus Nanopelagicales bacterium]|nr:hypothetical protein [Candidatus Nanopelagicales bacterium]